MLRHTVQNQSKMNQINFGNFQSVKNAKKNLCRVKQLKVLESFARNISFFGGENRSISETGRTKSILFCQNIQKLGRESRNIKRFGQESQNIPNLIRNVRKINFKLKLMKLKSNSSIRKTVAARYCQLKQIRFTDLQEATLRKNVN